MCSHLMSIHENCGIFICGDKNDLNIGPILAFNSTFKQIVTKCTLGLKTLDIIITNLHQSYNNPVIVPPVEADNPSTGKPSDHSVPVATPITSPGMEIKRDFQVKVFRPLPESLLHEFGLWITTENWNSVPADKSPTTQVEAFQNLLENKVSTIFPTKTVKITAFDKPWITAELKVLARRRKREYKKKGKSEKYVNLQKEFDQKNDKAAAEFLKKNVSDIKSTNPSKAYSILKKLGAKPGDSENNSGFTLPNHLEENFSVEESAEQIAQHFAAISQEFPPLMKSNLPEHVQEEINTEYEDIPILSEYEVYEQIKAAKKPKSQVPGDLPRRLVQEFAPELAFPATQIYNSITQTSEWPAQWCVEYGTPLKKKSEPETENDLRIISLTNFLSKNFEKFVLKWLLFYVGDKLDPNQYGGMKGKSISHYLIDFVNFVLYNQDFNIPHMILAGMIDFSKAFNRQNHNILITILCNMGVPGWLLKIVMGFLTNRSLILRFNGVSTSKKNLPGGGPQGTILGMFLFLILINFAGFSDKAENISDTICKVAGKRKPIEKTHLKYVDDFSILEAVNRYDLEVSTSLPQPHNYHSRTGQILPESKSNVALAIQDLLRYSLDHDMKINHDKSKLMLFNTSRVHDFIPAITMNGDQLDVVEEMKLLGVVITSDLKWSKNTEYITKKGFNRLWMMRRLKRIGASEEDLLDTYTKQVRSLLELAVPVWHAALTVYDRTQIERVQKTAFSIILGNKYTSYKDALETLEMDTLEERRGNLCLKFALKASVHPQFKNWFQEFRASKPRKVNDDKNDKYVVPYARTNRFEDSPIPYLTRLLNEHFS